MHYGKHVALAPPPRAVSLRATLLLALDHVLALVGFGLLLFGSLFFWVFVARSEAVTALEFRGPTREVRGVVTRSESTSSSENKRRVFEIRYRYEAGGKTRSGKSYRLGGGLPEGSPVRVEVLEADPKRSRVVGLRRRHFSAGVAFVTVVPVVGLSLALSGLALGLGRARLLREGRLGFAKLVGKRATGARVNGRPVVALRFRLEVPEPESPGGYRLAGARSTAHEFEVRTHETRPLEDEPFEAVVYDPRRPSRALALDVLPVHVTPEGEFHARGSGAAGMLLALLALALNAGLAWLFLG